MPHQRSRTAQSRLTMALMLVCGAAIASATIARAQSTSSTNTAFDELYERGQRANSGLKT